MSSVVIAGDTSGAITLQAPAVAGTTTLTLPASSGTIPVPTTVGTSGQLLQSNGASAPSWVTPAAGAMTFIQSVTAASSSTVSLTSLTSTYDMYMVVGTTCKATTGGSSLRVRFIIGGTAQSVSYKSNIIYTESGVSTFSNDNGNTSEILVNRFQFRNSTHSISFILYISNPSSTSVYKPITWQTFGSNSDPASTYQFGSGVYVGGTGAVTGLEFAASTSTIDSGTFRLYGISNS